GDAFTPAEIAIALEERDATLRQPFIPPPGERPYEKVSLDALMPTQRGVVFKGRVRNLQTLSTRAVSQAPGAAKGCLRVVIGDEGGAVMLRLWHAQAAYPLRLGQLLKVWTTHVAHAPVVTYALAPENAPLVTSIFPERDRGCHVQLLESMVHEKDCHVPLGCAEAARSGRPGQIPGLMGLATFAEGGCEVRGARVLVCVKGIGARRTVMCKDTTTATTVACRVFDNTTSATLDLWDVSVDSTSTWEPHKTILLLTEPVCSRVNNTNVTIQLKINNSTTIDIDPLLPDVRRLRSHAQHIQQIDSPAPPFPSNIFDMPAIHAALAVSPIGLDLSRSRVPALPPLPLHSLADLHAVARAYPLRPSLAYASLLLPSPELTALHRRGALAIGICPRCSLTLRANALEASCLRCTAPAIPSSTASTAVPLRLNPRILGPLVDETGALEPGAPAVADEAWAQLLGRKVEEVVRMKGDELRALEERIAWVRVTV
ncbi:uncharacterized protein K452DRAFT_196077, partial [Aplosporella prunicola CBS 121167]